MGSVSADHTLSNTEDTLGLYSGLTGLQDLGLFPPLVVSNTRACFSPLTPCPQGYARTTCTRTALVSFCGPSLGLPRNLAAPDIATLSLDPGPPSSLPINPQQIAGEELTLLNSLKASWVGEMNILCGRIRPEIRKPTEKSLCPFIILLVSRKFMFIKSKVRAATWKFPRFYFKEFST